MTTNKDSLFENIPNIECNISVWTSKLSTQMLQLKL